MTGVPLNYTQYQRCGYAGPRALGRVLCRTKLTRSRKLDPDVLARGCAASGPNVVAGASGEVRRVLEAETMYDVLQVRACAVADRGGFPPLRGALEHTLVTGGVLVVRCLFRGLHVASIVFSLARCSGAPR